MTGWKATRKPQGVYGCQVRYIIRWGLMRHAWLRQCEQYGDWKARILFRCEQWQWAKTRASVYRNGNSLQRTHTIHLRFCRCDEAPLHTYAKTQQHFLKITSFLGQSQTTHLQVSSLMDSNPVANQHLLWPVLPDLGRRNTQIIGIDRNQPNGNTVLTTATWCKEFSNLRLSGDVGWLDGPCGYIRSSSVKCSWPRRYFNFVLTGIRT